MKENKSLQFSKKDKKDKHFKNKNRTIKSKMKKYDYWVSF